MTTNEDQIMQGWAEVQALAARAAFACGVPSAQALAFGAMAARHLADERSEEALLGCLRTPGSVAALAAAVEDTIERASMKPGAIALSPPEGQAQIMISWLFSLPCAVRIEDPGPPVHVLLALAEPSTAPRPLAIGVGAGFWSDLEDMAGPPGTVPPFGGARLMETD